MLKEEKVTKCTMLRIPCPFDYGFDMTNVGNGRQLPGHPVSDYVDIPRGEAGGWGSRGSTHKRISIVASKLQVCYRTKESHSNMTHALSQPAPEM